jgi:rhodanese-related sulfurtransferase
MRYLEPRQAHEFLANTPGAVLIDCRSEIEYFFVGHPVGAVLVPWQDGPNWEVDPDFVAHVREAANPEQPVVLICRSGNRALEAGRVLEEAGFAAVYTVRHGFEGELGENNHRNEKTGWRREGLPWEQS